MHSTVDDNFVDWMLNQREKPHNKLPKLQVNHDRLLKETLLKLESPKHAAINHSVDFSKRGIDV